MAFGERPGWLRQSSPGVPSGVMVFCVSWRALGGRTEGVRALSFLPPQVLLACRYFAWCWRMRAARPSGCASKSVGTRKSSSYLGTATCYRRATVGSSHNDVHPDNPTLHTGAVRPHPGFVESLFFISPRTSTRTQVHEMLPAF